MLDVHRLMESLSARRPIFHSEADFQHEFAWEIHSANPASQIRLEYPMYTKDEKVLHLDLWLPVEQMAIELKYYTQELAVGWRDEDFELRNQGAHPPRRYDFVNDIRRLELSRCKRGLAVLLTNDPIYWKPPPRSGTIDAAFRIHEVQGIAGNLAWNGSPAERTVGNRESRIVLEGAYTMQWRDYSNCNVKTYGNFRYLAVTVQ